MKVSGKEVAEAILKNLAKEIKSKKLHPSLAVILANNSTVSRIYVKNKIKTAKIIGVEATLYEFSEDEAERCKKTIKRLNKDPNTSGIIVQYPVYSAWNFDEFENSIIPQKDVDGFLKNSPYNGATALAVWEMLTAFAYIEGFKKTEDFLKGKRIVVAGRGKTAGGPTIKLLESRGFNPLIVARDTPGPDEVIKSGDVVIGATGVKNILNRSNLKKGVYAIGVGMGKEMVDGREKSYGDVKEEDAEMMARLYCPTVGGIGPLTIACLLKNVVESCKNSESRIHNSEL